jgi:TorA maturation chaperone TorD
MANSVPTTDEAVTDAARECLYRFLAACLGDPLREGFALVLQPESQQMARQAAGLLREDAAGVTIPLGVGELPPERLDLGPLLEELARPCGERCAEYDRVFGLVPARDCVPFETEYHRTAEPFFRSQQLADVAGFYRAFGLEPCAAAPERPDHITLELEFMALLLSKKRLAQGTGGPDAAERVAVCERAEELFFRDHLAWWAPSFAGALRHKAGTGLYAAVGSVLAAWLPLERRRFGVDAPRLPLEATLIERPEEQGGCAACPAAG